MKILVTIALRNLMRNRRRTIITLTAIALGLGALLFLRNFMYGAQSQMVHNLVSTLTSDIQIIPQAQENIYNINGAIEDPAPILELLARDPRLRGYAPEIVGAGLIAGATESMATFIVGLDPERERQMGNTPPPLVSGRMLTSQDRAAMIMGEPMREILGVHVGDTVVLTGQDYYGALAGGRYTLIGTFETGNDQLDNGNVLVSLADARSLLSFGERASKILINVQPGQNLNTVAATLRQQIDTPTLSVMTWEQLIPMVAQMIEFQNGMIFVVVLVILIIVTAGILNTLLMSVTERTPEFGLMMALGTPPSYVIRLVMLEAALLVGFGAAMGVMLGTGATLLVGHYGVDLSHFTSALSNLMIGSRVYPKVDGSYLGLFVGIILTGTLLVSLIPAWRAGRLSPIAAMRQL